MQIQNALRRYNRFFLDDDHRKDYILQQTEGMARTFLEPLFLEPEPDQDPLELVEQVVSFLTNPSAAQIARNKYFALRMTSGAPFWTFYHEFRTEASTAGIRDENTLKMDLRDKILPRLRVKLFHEYRRSRTLSEWVAAIQEEDSGQTAERTVYGSPAISGNTRDNRARQTSSTTHENPTSRRSVPTTQKVIPEDTAPQQRSSTPGFSGNQQRPPWRSDTPRQNNPQSRNTPDIRHSTPRVNEIAVQEPTHDSDENDEFYDIPDELDDPPVSRAKDSA